MQPRKITTKKIPQGSVLLKPGAKITSVYVIQSGRISLSLQKGNNLVEISQLGVGQSIGDEAAFGPVQWGVTALALRTTSIVEIPLELIQEQMNKNSPNVKTFLKGFADRIKATYGELKTLKSNQEVLPCPPDNTAKVFGVIFHTARNIGTKQGEVTVANWVEFRKYANEVFDESIVRVEDAVNILIRLGYVKLEGDAIHLMDMSQIEAFFDYYGNYHFKGGYGDLLKTNSKMQKVTEEFLKVAEKYPADRGGNANLPYKETIDAMKEVLGNSFEADQLFRLEQKGLFIKRTTTQTGGILTFYKPDFLQMMLNWKILRELEQWNEKGFVEISTPADATQNSVDLIDERKKWSEELSNWKPAASANGVPKLRTGPKKAGEIWCSVCMSVVTREQKACGVCGAEVTGKAA